MSEDHGDHGHGHAHGHGHGHGHDSHGHAHPAAQGRAFAIGIALQSAFIVAEVVYGFAAHSLALLADAGHNLSDVLGLVVAWSAAVLSRSAPTAGRTYGLRRASILGALVNALSLIFVTGGVAWEAVLRLRSPEPTEGATVIVVALVGVVVNGLSAALFLRGSREDLNVRAAFLHLASDAVVSAGVAVAGFIVLRTGFRWLDPAVSLVVALLVIVSTWSLFRRAMNLALDAVPENVDEASVREFLLAREGVVAVHDLHIWGMSTSENVLTAHLAMAPLPDGDFVCKLDEELRRRFKLHHVTVQLEPPDAAERCAQASEHAV